MVSLYTYSFIYTDMGTCGFREGNTWEKEDGHANHKTASAQLWPYMKLNWAENKHSPDNPTTRPTAVALRSPDSFWDQIVVTWVHTMKLRPTLCSCYRFHRQTAHVETIMLSAFPDVESI